MPLIEHQSELPAYAPPGHSGTRNVRLVENDFCGRFEMVLGEIAPGGAADPHAHDSEAQVLYILEGSAEITLGPDPSRQCGPGTVVRIPAGLDHHVISLGPEPLKMVIIYSPPLPPRDDVVLEE